MPVALPPAPPIDPLLRSVLNLSLTAIQLLQPLYAAEGGALTDFALTYLNPAAQRLTGLAEQPGLTLRAAFAGAGADGVVAFCRQVFETGAADHADFPR